jgi:hypothetical protein
MSIAYNAIAISIAAGPFPWHDQFTHTDSYIGSTWLVHKRLTGVWKIVVVKAIPFA